MRARVKGSGVMVRRHNEGTRSGARRHFRRPSRGNDFRRGARARLHLQSLSSRTTPDLLQTQWQLSRTNIHLFHVNFIVEY